MALAKQAGANTVSEFNSIFSAAHDRCQNSGDSQSEPHFVRHLISDRTVGDLNNASPSLYDSSKNNVKFRAMFLHHSPFASFTASGVQCRRELADAMFVVYVTEPDALGVHNVVRRSACLLMFKSSDEIAPCAFSFDPAGGNPPSGTDQQQFYLFNQWPLFELQTGSKRNPKVHGTFNLAAQGFKPPASHDVGKFAVVWQSEASGPSTWVVDTKLVHWLAGEPTPNFAMNPQDASLGTLLDKFIEGAADVGRDFFPHPPAMQNWDALMGTLLGYPLQGPTALRSPPLRGVDGRFKDKTWASQLRDVNPSGLGFMALNSRPVGMSFLESIDSALATIAQHSREIITSGFGPAVEYPGALFLSQLMPDLKGNTPAQDIDEGNPFPVLIATISRFHSEEQPNESSGLTLSERIGACNFANQCLWELRNPRP